MPNLIRSPQAYDSQRGKVYKWEDAHLIPLLDKALTLDECHQLAANVSMSYGLEPPQIEDSRAPRSACWETPNRIKLPISARNSATVLHECAHGIMDCFYRRRSEAAHSSIFMCIYFNLLSRFTKLPMREIPSSATHAHLHIAAASQCPVPPGTVIKRLQQAQVAEQAAYGVWLKAKREAEAVKIELTNFREPEP